MDQVFTTIEISEIPSHVECDKESYRNSEFDITLKADGFIPFPQLIIKGGAIGELIFKNEEIHSLADNGYQVKIPAGVLSPGHYQVQVEGCRKSDIALADGSDWIKVFADITVDAPEIIKPVINVTGGSFDIKIYYGIHKHMHQPYYNSVDTQYWDGEKDEIFGSRIGPYTHFIPAAVRQYVEGGLPHAGLSTSWSGSLIEQLNRCAGEGLCGGRFSNWNDALRSIVHEKTALGNPRTDFVSFGFYHPLMSLIPHRDIVRQTRLHQKIIRDTFGLDASPVMFPPETAFHVRMIPALKEAGIKAIIYDSIHRSRTCKDYVYSGMSEGMLPPNPSDQENAPVGNWLQLRNIWTGSMISPALLKPEYIKYEDPDGNIHKIIGVPAERYIGNEDARGGFGALQYPDIFGQVYDNVKSSGLYDPAHPPFFILHSDGDNHGGGADSYYNHNTGNMVRWLHEDSRFELITIRDYLHKFPPDPDKAVHVEPGSWSGADNGDPQFMKWFSRYKEPYSPDLNSWAALTAFQNLAHTLEDCMPTSSNLDHIMRLLLTAETSCYWYWTGQTVWDRQVTDACNAGYEAVKSDISSLQAKDTLGPTIFAPWITPENPGGKTWGQGCLIDSEKTGTAHTFIFDINGIKRVDCVIRSDGREKRLPMKNNGPYPTQTGAALTADYYTIDLPEHLGNIRYYIEAEDNKGNISSSSLERIFIP